MNFFKKIFKRKSDKKSKKSKSADVAQPPAVENNNSTATTATVASEPSNTEQNTVTATGDHNIKENLNAIIKGIQENRILEVFDKYYHDDVVMFEKGDSTNRIGKEANRKAEEAFVNNAKIHEARVLRTIVDGNNTAYEMYMDFNYGEMRIKKTQWSFMEWKDGKVIKEEFNDSNTTPAAPATESSSSSSSSSTEHNIRANLEEIIKGIQENRILEVFDKYYHDDVVMFEKGDSTNRIGKAANRKAEESFVNNAKIHEARVLKTIVDGNNTAYEMYMDFNYGEMRIKKTQWSFMEWKDGKVIKEEFNDSNTTPAAPATESSPSSTEHNIKANLEEIIKGIQENRILEVFDKYYHDDIVMFEKGDSTNRIGKEANRKAEESFVNNATIHEARVLKTIVDGNNTAYEMYMDFTYGGHQIKKTQWSFMEWKDGKVIKEEFNDSNTTPAAAPVEHNIRANLEEIIKGIQENRILEVFDKYYHDDVVMFEKGDSTNRIGKEANRKAEEAFVNNAKIHEARVLRTIVDGNNTAYEMYMDFTYGGHSIQKSQWSFMEWKDGKVIKEEFNDSNTTPVQPPAEESPVEHDIRANLEAIIKGIQENRILEVFDKYYHDDVVMFEKGDSTNRVGKEANRKAEESFVNNAVINEARVLKTIVDGNNTAYEMYMDFTYGGHPVKKTQWSFMEWQDGKVIKEEFNDSNTTPAAPATTESSSTEHNIRANLEEIIKGIQENRILEVFDKYYHDDIVMFEKGDSANRIGKEANRKAEESFVNNATIHEARVLKTIVDGNNTAYEMYMDFTYGGHQIKKTQWSFMEWKDGKVIKEEFNDSNTTPAAAPETTEESK